MSRVVVPGVVLLLAGCSAVADRHVRVSPTYADDPAWVERSPRPEEGVVVTEGDIRRPYLEFATITVESRGREVALSFSRMRREAARIGADAVVRVVVSKEYQGQSTAGGVSRAVVEHKLVGVAVRFAP